MTALISAVSSHGGISFIVMLLTGIMIWRRRGRGEGEYRCIQRQISKKLERHDRFEREPKEAHGRAITAVIVRLLLP